MPLLTLVTEAQDERQAAWAAGRIASCLDPRPRLAPAPLRPVSRQGVPRASRPAEPRQAVERIWSCRRCRPRSLEQAPPVFPRPARALDVRPSPDRSHASPVRPSSADRPARRAEVVAEAVVARQRVVCTAARSAPWRRHQPARPMPISAPRLRHTSPGDVRPGPCLRAEGSPGSS